MSQKKQILIKLQNIFRVIFDDDNIKLNSNTTAEDIEEWDSLNQIRIILACEKEFSVKLNVREVNNFADIGEMVAHLKSINAQIN